MGFADLIPGISGGTVALLTNIYQTLISSLHDFFTKFRISRFLLQLVLGIALAVLLGSFLLSFLFNTVEFYLLITLIGILFFSSLFLIQNYYQAFIGFLLGLSLAFLPSMSSNIFIAGFLAGVFMLLPGISGSFVLLILGVYPSVLEMVTSFNPLLLLFALAVLAGIITSVFSLRLLFKKYHLTSFFAGIILGSLLLLSHQARSVFASESLLLAFVLFLLPSLFFLKIYKR